MRKTTKKPGKKKPPNPKPQSVDSSKPARSGGSDGLTHRERLFADAYLRTGHGEGSAIEAGYTSNSAGTTAPKLLRKPHIAEYIRNIQVKTHSSNIASREERMGIMSSIVRGTLPDTRMSDRVAASKLLSQMSGELVHRHEHAGANGGAIQIEQVSIADLIQLLKG